MSPPLSFRYPAQKLAEALPTTDGGVLQAGLAARSQADPRARAGRGDYTTGEPSQT
jgi:hypothetical protein